MMDERSMLEINPPPSKEQIEQALAVTISQERPEPAQRLAGSSMALGIKKFLGGSDCMIHPVTIQESVIQQDAKEMRLGNLYKICWFVKGMKGSR